MRILTSSQLVTTTWPGIDLAEEFGGGLLKLIHFHTRLAAARCNLLQVLTPSTASSIQAICKRRTAMMADRSMRFFVTPLGTLTIPILEEAVRLSSPSQVLIDPDTLAPDLKVEVAANLKQAIWLDDSIPPADWNARINSELEI